MTLTTSALLPVEVPDVEVLADDECWRLLTAAPIGRIAVQTDDGVDIFPVNFLVTDRFIYLRSAPGSKLVDIASASAVAFETDGRRGRKHWSVVVHGNAKRMSFEGDILGSGVLALETATSSAKWNFIRITPSSISGRRFVATRSRS